MFERDAILSAMGRHRDRGGLMVSERSTEQQRELFERDAVLAHFAENRGALLRSLRLALMLKCRPVSADDVRPILQEWGIPPGNWLGALFKAPGWHMVGFHTSSTRGGHGNRIGLWEWREK
jgi:hypothetical protein